MNDNLSQDRQLATEAIQVWIYQDSYDDLMKLCEESGSQPGDVLRDAFDEWLSWRRLLIESFSKPIVEFEPDRPTVSSIDNLLERIRRDGW
jgi:hypothetical protein